MIKIKDISKSFADKMVLDGIDAEFEQGKTNLIIGSSGTGKSVLLKCIVGLINPDKGDVYYDLRNFTEADKEVKSEIRREIGMLFQGGALFDSKKGKHLPTVIAQPVTEAGAAVHPPDSRTELSARPGRAA